MALPATEPFTYAVGAIPNPPWTQMTTSGNVTTNGTQGTAGVTVTDLLAFWNNDSFAADQYSQYQAKTIGPGDGSDYLYLGVRVTHSGTGAITPTNTFYWFWSDGGSDTAITKNVIGSGNTPLATANATAYAVNDTFKLQVSGSNITVFKNGVSFLTATDSAITTGPPAMGLFETVSNSFFFDNWQGDNVSTTGLPPGLGPAGEMEMATQSAISSMMR